MHSPVLREVHGDGQVRKVVESSLPSAESDVSTAVEEEDPSESAHR